MTISSQHAPLPPPDSDSINALGKTQVSQGDVISSGIVLTPSAAADLLVQKCLQYLDKNHSVLAGDYCSGAGAFIGALNRNLPQARTLSFEQNRILHQLSCQYYESPQNRILLLDALFDTGRFSNTFDLLVGNPPYVRAQNIPRELKDRLLSDVFYHRFLKGSYDLSVAFLAKSVCLLKDGGIGGLIVSRKLLFSSYGELVCRYLQENARILEIIDFGGNQLFADKTTYVSMLIFRKERSTASYTFRYYPIPTLKRTQAAEIIGRSEEYLTTCHSCALKSFPWKLQSHEEHMIMQQIGRNSIPLTSLFSITQGFRTGNNRAFLADSACSGEPCLRPYIDGTNIKRGFLSGCRQIIWPYYRHKSKYALMPESDFAKLNPQAYARLQRLPRSVQREDWYGYRRPQNLSAMETPKIFLKEMMPRAEFAADPDGTICFSSGYALIPIKPMPEEELTAWALILSTSIMEYQYRCVGTNLHSGWFRMYKSHAEKVRLPRIDLHGDNSCQSIVRALAHDISNDSLWERLNNYIAEQFGLSGGCVRRIDAELNEKHLVSMPREKSGDILPDRKWSGAKKLTDKPEETAYPELSEEERTNYLPVELTCYNKLHEERGEYRTLVTYQNDKRMPIQRWYKYTQGYSTALVNKLLSEFGAARSDFVFDPFCGGGTTLLAARSKGISSAGCDVSPLSCWISKIKTHSWTEENAAHIAGALTSLRQGYDDYDEQLPFHDFLAKIFFPPILAQTVHIQNWISSTQLEQIEKDFLNLALASIQEELSVIRKHGSHYRFLNDETHVGVHKLNIKLAGEDTDVAAVFKHKVFNMLDDVTALRPEAASPDVRIFCSDIRSFSEPLPKATIVITSPPYLNRNNYFSQQKIELSLLHLIESEKSYSELVKKSFCSHIEAVLPDSPVCVIPEVNTIISAVMRQKSNNAKIPHMIAGYFNDMDIFFQGLPNFLAPKARLAFVVANCRWNGVVVPVDHLICRIAEQYGLAAKKIVVARMKGNSPQQMRKYGRIPVRESIVILENT